MVTQFLYSKNKKRKQREKRKSFKAETIKRLSPRWKCYCFSNVYCLILECLELKYFSVFHHRSTLKSIWPALPNLALICAALYRKLYLSEVRVGMHSVVRFIICNDFKYFRFLILFYSISFKHVNSDIAKKKKKRIRYSFINSIFRSKFLRFNFP